MKFRQRVSQISRKKQIVLIFLLSLVLRLFFFFVGSEIYFSKAGIQVLGDTHWWTAGVQNLVEIGTYTVDPKLPNGAFYRPPGYALFLLPLYLIFGKWSSVFVAAVAIQIIIDCFSSIIFYFIAYKATGKQLVGLIAGLLYSTYFFGLGWTVVTYPETLSIFFLALGTYYFFKSYENRNALFLMGLFLGISALLRIQILLVLPVGFFFLLMDIYKNKAVKAGFIRLAIFVLGCSLSYGLWPIRNLLLHNEMVVAQKMDFEQHWSPDFLSFRDFVWSVKTDIEPEMTQLMQGNGLSWPTQANLTDREIKRINYAISLMDSCGTGLYSWRKSNGFGHLNSEIEIDCNQEIELIWRQLIQSQKSNNAWNYYVRVPIGNLQKAFFKSNFVPSESEQFRADLPKQLVSFIIFSIRSMLIVLGLIAILMANFGKHSSLVHTAKLFNFILAVFLCQYLFIAFYVRSVEMRYFVQVDSLMLIPVAYILSKILPNGR